MSCPDWEAQSHGRDLLGRLTGPHVTPQTSKPQKLPSTSISRPAVHFGLFWSFCHLAPRSPELQGGRQVATSSHPISWWEPPHWAPGPHPPWVNKEVA